MFKAQSSEDIWRPLVHKEEHVFRDMCLLDMCLLFVLFSGKQVYQTDGSDQARSNQLF